MINNDVLKNAISLLRVDMGDIEGLPLELQNTIANIYYKLSQHALDVSGDNKLPRSITGAKNLAKGYKGYIEETTFLLECRKSLPEMVAILKKEIIGQKSQNDIDFVTFALLGTFKYRVPNATQMSVLRLRFECWRRKSRVDEIENLYRLFR